MRHALSQKVIYLAPMMCEWQIWGGFLHAGEVYYLRVAGHMINEE